jgi:PAS domain S-box-containing protein
METSPPDGLLSRASSQEQDFLLHQAATPATSLAQAQALLAEALAQQEALRLENQQLHAARQELVASEARLKAAEAVAGMGSYELDLVTGALHFSEGMYRLFGEVPYAFTPSVEWIDARSDAEDAATIHHVLGQAQHDKLPYHYTRRIRRADGQWRLLESHGRVVCDAAGAAIRFEGIVEEKTEQRQAAQELQASRELLRATIDSSLNMVQVFEAVRNEQGEIADFIWTLNNQASEQLYGDVIGQRLLERDPGVVESGLFDTFKQVVETGQPDQGERHYTGEQFNGWVYQSTVKLHDGVATTTTDISERKRNEQEILDLKDEIARRAEDKYHTLFNAIEEGFCLFEMLYDKQGKAVDYRFLEVNQVFERRTGLVDVAGKLASDLAPGTEPYWLDTYAQVVQTGEPTRFENYHASTGRWYEAYAARMGGVGSRQVCTVFNDITERKRHEEQQAFLLQLSDRLRPLASPLAIQQAALQVAGQHLDLDRLLYNEIDPDVTTYTVRASYAREEFTAYGGRQPMEPFTESVRALQQGITKIVYDVETDESFSLEEKAICASIQVRAFVTVPLLKNGHWVLNLVAHSSKSRQWTPQEITLLEETAERTWAAVERARVEEALRESEARFRNLVEAHAQAVWETDPTGRVVQDSPSWRAYTGQTLAEWLGYGWLAAVHPDDRAYTEQQWREAVAARQNMDTEYRLHCADGSYCWTNVRATPLRDAQGNIYKWAGMNINIHQQKQAEEARRQSEERLRMAIEAAELGTWDWDLTTNEVRWNAHHYTQMGMEPAPGPLTLDDFARYLHPDDRPEVLRRLQVAVDENQLFEADYRVITAQNELRWMNGHGQATDTTPDGRVRRMSGVMLDVTERKHAEQHLQAQATALERKVERHTQALRESRDLLQSVYDTTLVGMAVLHAVRDEAGTIKDFTFISVNQELARATGRSDLVGQRYTQAFPGFGPSSLLALMRRTTETGESQQTEYYYPHEGVEQWYASMYVKLDDGVVATTLNITERKHAEQEVLKNLRLLEQAERLAQLGSWEYELATATMRWSAGMYRLFGLPEGSPVQPSCYLDYAVPTDRPAAERVVQALLTTHTDIQETLRIRVGEEEKTIRINMVALRDAAGQPARLLGVDLDISQVQRLQADNLRLRLRQQQTLFEAVQAAQETERKRIAESLHNGLGQLLFATKLRFDQLHELASATAPALAAAHQQADRLLAEAIRQTRALSHELVPMTLEEFGLPAALKDICQKLSSPRLRFYCQVQLDEAAPPLPAALQLALYRMAQELGQNIVKHAQGATEASLELETTPGFVLLRAEDNGPGFASNATNHAGLGLRSIRDRVALLGGMLDVSSAAQSGAYVRIRIPIPSTFP